MTHPVAHATPAQARASTAQLPFESFCKLAHFLAATHSGRCTDRTNKNNELHCTDDDDDITGEALHSSLEDAKTELTERTCTDDDETT